MQQKVANTHIPYTAWDRMGNSAHIVGETRMNGKVSYHCAILQKFKQVGWVYHNQNFSFKNSYYVRTGQN